MTPTRLRETIASLNWTQRGLARMLQCDERMVRHWAIAYAPSPDSRRIRHSLGAAFAVLLACVPAAQGATATARTDAACDLQGQYLIFFATGIANPEDATAQPRAMAARASALIAGIADAWQHNRSPLLIVGHVDAQELKSTTPVLALARANAVRHALVKAGVDPDALWVRADGMHGAMLPDAPGAEIQNRFVAVTAPQATSDCPGTPVP